MKFFIWFCCLGVAAIIITIIQHGMGVLLGPLPKTLIGSIASAIAIRLCKLYNSSNQNENEDPDIPDEDEIVENEEWNDAEGGTNENV